MCRLLLFTLLTLLGLAIPISAQDSCDSGDCGIIEVAAAPQYGLPAEVIDAYEMPNFTQLEVDQSLLHDRWYWRVIGELQVYDAPNGNLIRTVNEGFNFVTALRTEGEWVEINTGEWAHISQLEQANDIVSSFTGIFLPEEPLAYPVAWMLVNAYPSKEPGGEPDESQSIIWRYTLVNIFATETVGDWNWYQIGVNQWVHQTSVAKVITIPKPADVDTEKWISVDLYEQTMVAYEGERPIFATLVSSGLPRWPTYEGIFHIYYRRTRTDMSWGTPGDDFYVLEEVPWTMFFDDGRALHGTYWHDGLGYRRSHGCVNLAITDAYWLFNWVAEEFEGKLNSPDIETGPAVYVWSSGTYR